MRHWYSEDCVPGSAEAIKKRRQRATAEGRKRYNDYMRKYMKERK